MLFTMLSEPDAVAGMALGDLGFLSAMAPGSIWVNSSTVNPSFARRMADEARKRGVRYLDAPVTGSKDAAEHGDLVFLVGGETSDVDACRLFLSSMGRRIIHVGAHGLGSSLKIVNNFLAAVTLTAFAEGAALGQALGISRQMLFDSLMEGPMVPAFVVSKRAKFEGDACLPEFPLRWMQKDLHLASISGYEAGVPTVLGSVTKELDPLAMREGMPTSTCRPSTCF